MLRAGQFHLERLDHAVAKHRYAQLSRAVLHIPGVNRGAGFYEGLRGRVVWDLTVRPPRRILESSSTQNAIDTGFRLLIVANRLSSRSPAT
jgi:hypothetical protein